MVPIGCLALSQKYLDLKFMQVSGLEKNGIFPHAILEAEIKSHKKYGKFTFSKSWTQPVDLTRQWSS